MGSNEEGKPLKPENSSSPDQTSIHVYPDWVGMQAYYGPRFALPPYYNSAIVSGHAPHQYMWGPPQHMMAPYGAPYATVYSPGGMYAHPPVPPGPHSHLHGISSSPAASELVTDPLQIDIPTKSSENTGCSLMKKLKGFNGLVMSIGNGNTDHAEGGTDQDLSQSGEAQGSSDASDGNTLASGDTGRKRSCEVRLTGQQANARKQARPDSAGEFTPVSSNKDLSVAVTPAGTTTKVTGTVGVTMPTLELKNSSSITSPTPSMLPSGAWSLNERELKREKRKQSNRESARRSRMRKQVEAEELAMKVEALGAENATFKSEINQLVRDSEKLRLENAALMEKLNNAERGKTEGMAVDNLAENTKAVAVSTENLLSRVNNMVSADQNLDDEGIAYEKNHNSGAKLHQLLDPSPRPNAMAAG